MLTRETSELTSPDIWPPNRMAFQTSPVTVLLLFHLLAQIKSEIKTFTLHFLRNNMTVNVTKVVLQCSAVTEMV